MDYATIIGYVSIGILILSGLWIIVGIVMGIIRGFSKSVARLLTVAASFIIAFAVSKPLATLFSQAFAKLAQTLLNNAGAGSASSLLDASVSATLSTLVSEIPVALISPILFVLLFIILSFVLFIVYRLIAKLINLIPKTPFPAALSRVLGALIGAIASCFVIVALLLPVAGYVNLANDVLVAVDNANKEAQPAANEAGDGTIVNAEAESDSDDGFFAKAANINNDLIAPLCKVKVISLVDSLTHNLFDTITVIEVNDKEVVLADEASTIIVAYSHAEPLTKGLENFGTEQSESVKLIIADLKNSDLLKSIICEIIPNAVEAWNKNESFVGIAPVINKAPDNVKPLMNDLLSIMGTMNEDSIEQDLNTVSELIEVIAKNDAFRILTSDNLDLTSGAKGVSELFGSNDFISDMLAVLNRNERFKPLVRSVTNLGLNTIGQMLSLPKDTEEVYENLIGDVTEILSSAADQPREEIIAQVKEEFGYLFDEYGIKVTDEEIGIIVECILSDCGSLSDINSENVQEYFSMLKDSEISEDNIVVNNESEDAEFTSVDAEAPKSRFELSEESINRLKGISLAIQLSTPKQLKHNVVTINDMLLDTATLNEMTEEQIINDGKAISSALLSLITFCSSVQSAGDISLDSFEELDFSTLSDAVQVLNGTTLFAGAAPKLVSGALQSMDLGIPASTVIKLADDIANDKGDDKEYTEKIFAAIKGSVSLVNKLKDPNLKPEELEPTVTELLSTLTPESADTIAEFITPSFIKKNISGVKTEDASKISVVLKTMFGKLGTNSGLTDEQCKAEAAAINSLLKIVMNEKHASERGTANDFFDSISENGTRTVGTLEKTPAELIRQILDSKIACATVVECNDPLCDEKGYDPFNLEPKVESAKTQLVAALNSELTAGEDANTIIAVASFCGLNIEIVNGVAYAK